MNDRGWRRYWRYLTGRFRGEVDDELVFHLEMRTADLIRDGMGAEAARHEAERRFGDRKRIQSHLERVEQRRGTRMARGFWLGELWQDLRHGARGLRKRPGFTALAAGSLAVGIAGVTVALAVVDSWVLRPLPVAKPNELVVIGSTSKPTGSLISGVSLSTIRDLRPRRDLFRDVAGFRMFVGGARPAGADRGEMRLVLLATGNYFTMLGVRPALGRVFGPADDERRERVIVLTHRYWTVTFGGRPDVIGTTLYYNRLPFTIVGVLPAGFHGIDQLVRADAFIPAETAEAAFNPAGDPSQRNYYQIVARRRLHQTAGTIQAALEPVSAQIGAQHPSYGEGYRLIAMPEEKARPSLATGGTALIGAAVFIVLASLVLLAACINTANLILARNTTRQTELTVRRALGASSGRVIRQLVTESVLLSGAGLVAAWFLAHRAIDWLLALPMPPGLPVSLALEFDARTFGLAAVVTVIASLVAGLGPAVVGARGDLQHGLRAGGRGGISRARARVRGILVVGQIAAATVVLVSAGLFRSSTRAAGQLDLGLKSDHVLTIGINASTAQYDATTARITFDRMERAIRDLRGVRSVAWTSALPLSTLFNPASQEVFPDHPAVASKTGGLASNLASVEPDYFDVLRVPLVAGRAFTTRDDSTSARVAIVSERAALLMWPGQSPIGHLIRLGADGPAVEVVGVAKNSRHIFIGEQPQPMVYVPLAQRFVLSVALIVRTEAEPNALLPEVLAALTATDRDLVPYAVRTMDEIVNGMNGLLMFRVGSTIASSVGLVALVLTVIGLYGVIAYGVSQRTREIGIRMALGEDRGRVVRAIVLQGGTLAGLGVGIGVLLALGVTRALSTLLVGVSATDLTVFGTVILGLVVVALGSAYIPARRAARLDPVRALRADG